MMRESEDLQNKSFKNWSFIQKQNSATLRLPNLANFQLSQGLWNHRVSPEKGLWPMLGTAPAPEVGIIDDDCSALLPLTPPPPALVLLLLGKSTEEECG